MTVEIGDVGEGPTGSLIAVGKMAGGASLRISKPHGWGSHCDWRPTSSREIVFSDHDLGMFPDMTVSSNLHVLDADGSHLRQLTHFTTGKMRATQPRWTPDGERVLFTAVDGDGSFAHRQMASATPAGDQIEPATGAEYRSGTHPTLQPVG